MNNYQFIKAWTDNGIGKLELQRPEVLNAINRSMVVEILAALRNFDQLEQVKVIVLSGAGRSFAAGADIKEMAEENAISMEMKNQFADWDKISLIKKPVIAAVQGFVLGGGFELALCADIVFAAASSKFGFPEVQLGVMPSAGGTVKLTKLMGKRKALEFLWTGNQLKAEEAKHWGIVNQVVPDELLLQETIAFAENLVKQPALSLRLIKDTVEKAEDLPIYEAMQYERKNFYLLFASEDQKEGMQAFMEKRSPHFKGK
ncbi:enoyl-CoA hydratase/isomerase family protein [Virgibacillus pantothenticus]|uniref:enoyl-CoA hydratase/isomerase family protein n=1 Tax=Virgibacillus pantothenticus TaxID=1473 RepID=UPI001C231683|nr:enoyl-CoA hydratase-related protein [Virgibacillus pantothenticus]MBU8568806.1 enoyl-CoA hydratase/isomerase family protein [Virgibacillus pantothenticus]MBU8602846.1 enoyl-CoA hydratase/isomerase family protein [Virgibacillus pantothenticus]MBU8636937.1 enoyl-CoA hydratase/isomerase family protein [Virgibacillus pantothenticus]MBU8644692.1 enoyl-CoA hydratase/isomerase family protein [Virgibacillus pantothenticus]MBU8648821.1 enoyl-CoA hydratase/isomerase family protein [Virgibacillus pant